MQQGDDGAERRGSTAPDRLGCEAAVTQQLLTFVVLFGRIMFIKLFSAFCFSST